jgi:hypothetical protein
VSHGTAAFFIGLVRFFFGGFRRMLLFFIVAAFFFRFKRMFDGGATSFKGDL